MQSKPQTLPPWATPERLRRLVELFHQNVNACLLGHDRCRDPLHYQRVESAMLPHSEMEHARVEQYSGASVKVTEWDAWVVSRERRDYLATYENRYQVEEEAQIAEWKAQDRDEVKHARLEERARLHDLEERQPWEHRVFTSDHVPFDPVVADAFYANRPAFYLKGLHADVEFQRVATVRVPSTTKLLHVPLPRMGKNARRKLARYGVEPKGLSPQNHAIVQGAVRAWRKRVGLD